MKKRVRVYKAGGESNQPTQEQIVSYISQRMSADDYDGDTDALKDDLAGAGIDEDVADEYITSVSNDLGLNQDTVSIEEQQRLAAEEEARTQEEEQALLEEQNAAEEARQQQLAAMYNTDIDMSTTEDTPEDEANYMKQGGSKLSKRSFIKEYTKLAKMGQGGNTPSPGADDVLNGRESHVKGFLGAVKNTANEAALKQAAEAQYNSVYGAPQVGAFQEGGIQQEQIDTESPYDHLAKDTAARRHIFSDNMYTQNDIAALEQFGGNTGQGLYKFIGGGDNESADEEYQDADIDFNQEEYQMGGFRMPRRSGRQYTQAVNSPYYTATGERAAAPDLAGRQVSSVDVTKRGIFGRPKAYTVNYGANNEYLPAQSKTIPETTKPESSTSNVAKPNLGSTCSPSNPAGCKAPGDASGSNQPVANWMMKSGIPGIKQWGAHMTKSGVIPETPMGTENVNSTTTAPTQPGNEPYYPPMDARSQRREARDDAKLNRFLGTNDAAAQADAKEIARLQNKMPGYTPFKKQGGPIDYTEYAYGGDIAVPDLYRAQAGVEQKIDPNANALAFNGLDKDLMNEDLSFAEPTEAKTPLSKEQELLKYQRGYNQQLSYVDPKVAGENIAGIGTTDAPIIQRGTSEDYQVKKDWNKTRDNFDLGKAAVEGVLDINDKVNARKQENQMLANTTSAEANYGISNADNRGDYDPNSGLFRPDQMGAMQSKYGGGIYATGGSTEDEDEDTQYMTQEEIDDFIANGGELEYL